MSLAVAAAALTLSALTGLAFALWVENGSRIFLSLVEAGLACF